MNSMDLDRAYEIAGGYVEADNKTFEAAIKLIEKHDKELAELCVEARKQELAGLEKRASEEKITLSFSVLSQNTEYLYEELGKKDLDSFLLEDEEVVEALENTPIVDTIDGKAVRLEGDERRKYIEMLVEKTKLDVLCEQSKSTEFAEQPDEEKGNYLKRELKTSFLSSLMHLRTSAQIEANIPQAKDAIVDDNEEFFVKQQEALGNMVLQDRAANFTEVVEVPADHVIAACAETEKKASKFADTLSKLSTKALGKSKSLLSKASDLISKAKNSFAEKAKKVWGERYEFAKRLRDRAPKTITDIAATVGLIGATAVNAPWLGTAVVAYGAYKVASSWVWPIVTKAREQARLDKEKNQKNKVKFMDRLRQASHAIFSNKKERMAYFKEAGWGSAAGLVGLGAAGAVASGALGAAGAVAARSAQRLASMAVSSVSGAINTVRTVKSKDKDFWDKAFMVAGFAATTAILVNCVGDAEAPDGGTEKPETNTVSNTNTSVVSEDVKPEVTITTEETVSTETVVEEPKVTTITAPTAWSEESGITERQWNRLQSFWGGAEKYQEYYSKITDDMLKPGGAFEGMTRDEVLFKYERMSSWNLVAHHSAIAKLDGFFECGTETLTHEDGLILDQVMDDGSILGVKGTGANVVISRDINCGGESELSITTIKTEDVSTETEVVSNGIETEVKSETQTEFDVTAGVNTNVEDVKLFDVNIVKANNLGDGEVISTVGADDVATSSDNTKIVTDALLGDQTSGNGDNTLLGGETSDNGDNTLLGGEASGNGDNTLTGGETSGNGDNTLLGGETSGNGDNTLLGGETSGNGDRNLTGGETQVIVDWENAEVVADSEDVKAGTPAAGNVEERGGYNNSGITERQYSTMQTFFKDRYGENAYDFFSSMITDEMRAKGGIFEGLSVEQSMFSVKQMVAWSNDQHGEFSEEITATIDYLKGCKENISQDMAPQVKEVIDRVNENGTIDGVTGTRPVVVRYFQVGDCGEAGTYGVDKASSGITHPSTDGFDRLYLRPQTTIITEEPIQVGFDEVDGKNYEFTEEKELNAELIKANNLEEGKQLSDNIEASSIETEVKNREIVTEKPKFAPVGNQR